MPWSPDGRILKRDIPAPHRRPSCRATAIWADAQAIVTSNISDFPAAALSRLRLEALHPDDFLLDQLDLSPPTILRVIGEQAGHIRRPSLTPQDDAVLLGRAGVPKFADEIRRLMSTPVRHP